MITNRVYRFRRVVITDDSLKTVAKYIDDVEALGEISFSSMDKVAKIISRNRKLTTQTARLFMEPRVYNLNLYDCSSKYLISWQSLIMEHMC